MARFQFSLRKQFIVSFFLCAVAGLLVALESARREAILDAWTAMTIKQGLSDAEIRREFPPATAEQIVARRRARAERPAP